MHLELPKVVSLTLHFFSIYIFSIYNLEECLDSVLILCLITNSRFLPLYERIITYICFSVYINPTQRIHVASS